jgi:hypothetical protein
MLYLPTILLTENKNKKNFLHEPYTIGFNLKDVTNCHFLIIFFSARSTRLGYSMSRWSLAALDEYMYF